MGVEVWTARDTREQGEATPQDLPEPPQPVVEQSASSASDIEEMDAQTLQATVAACTKCRLSETRTNTVFGSGSLEADLMFIGEGPGQEEDRQGLPFVGKAGKLLTAMIAALGYERDQVYISNVVKCRPPKNRDPFPEEASACSRYLKRQIEIIKPKVIVALGRGQCATAARYRDFNWCTEGQAPEVSRHRNRRSGYLSSCLPAQEANGKKQILG